MPAVKKAVKATPIRITTTLLVKYLAAEVAAKAASALVKSYRDKIKESMGDETERVVAKRYKIAWPVLTRQVFDKKAFAKAHPKLVTKFTGAETYRPLEVTDLKGDD